MQYSYSLYAISRDFLLKNDFVKIAKQMIGKNKIDAKKNPHSNYKIYEGLNVTNDDKNDD